MRFQLNDRTFMTDTTIKFYLANQVVGGHLSEGYFSGKTILCMDTVRIENVVCAATNLKIESVSLYLPIDVPCYRLSTQGNLQGCFYTTGSLPQERCGVFNKNT
jgi:hypothetical protein